MLTPSINSYALENQQPDLKDFKVIDGAYLYEYSQVITARSEDIYAVLSDHDQISLLNPNVQASSIISRGDDTLKRSLKIKQCVLVFCFKMIIVVT